MEPIACRRAERRVSVAAALIALLSVCEAGVNVVSGNRIAVLVSLAIVCLAAAGHVAARRRLRGVLKLFWISNAVCGACYVIGVVFVSVVVLPALVSRGAALARSLARARGNLCSSALPCAGRAARVTPPRAQDCLCDPTCHSLDHSPHRAPVHGSGASDFGRAHDDYALRDCAGVSFGSLYAGAAAGVLGAAAHFAGAFFGKRVADHLRPGGGGCGGGGAGVEAPAAF